MGFKNFLKADTKKKHFKSKGVYKIKKEVKKLKDVVEAEAKNTIKKSRRRESVYTPLEENATFETVTKKTKRKITSTELKLSDTLEQVAVNESEINLEAKKKQKKKKNKNVNCDQPIKKLKKNEIISNESEIDNDLSTSESVSLLPEADSNRDLRTVYVGNLPVNFKKKKLLKVLKQYGNIEKMWTRGAKPLTNFPKKVAVNKRVLPENHPPLMVHALFKSIAEAHSALKLNGELYEENRLRVTLSQEKVYDSRKGVFIGNLPFDVKDEDLFDKFEQCGEIVNVRVIRDEKYGAGKGFGYVNFQSVDSVELALNLNEEKINGRIIRVQRLFSPGKKKKIDKKKEKQLLKTNSKSKMSFSVKHNKVLNTTEKRPKKKNKLNVADLKKKILAQKLSLKPKKNADSSLL